MNNAHRRIDPPRRRPGCRRLALGIAGPAAPRHDHAEHDRRRRLHVLTVSVPHGCDGSAPPRSRSGRRTTSSRSRRPATVLRRREGDHQARQADHRRGRRRDHREDDQVVYTAKTPLPDGQRDTFELAAADPGGRRREDDGLPRDPDLREGGDGLDRGPGSRAAEDSVEHPAPAFEVTAAAAAGDDSAPAGGGLGWHVHAGGGTDHDSAASHTDSDDDNGNGLAIAGLVAGLLGSAWAGSPWPAPAGARGVSRGSSPRWRSCRHRRPGPADRGAGGGARQPALHRPRGRLGRRHAPARWCSPSTSRSASTTGCTPSPRRRRLDGDGRGARTTGSSSPLRGPGHRHGRRRLEGDLRGRHEVGGSLTFSVGAPSGGGGASRMAPRAAGLGSTGCGGLPEGSAAPGCDRSRRVWPWRGRRADLAWNVGLGATVLLAPMHQLVDEGRDLRRPLRLAERGWKASRGRRACSSSRRTPCLPPPGVGAPTGRRRSDHGPGAGPGSVVRRTPGRSPEPGALTATPRLGPGDRDRGARLPRFGQADDRARGRTCGLARGRGCLIVRARCSRPMPRRHSRSATTTCHSATPP